MRFCESVLPYVQRSEHTLPRSDALFWCFSSMPAKQAPPLFSPATEPDFGSDALAPQAGAAHSKAVFQRLMRELKAGAAPGGDLVTAAVRAAQQSGWPSAAVVQELTSHLVSAASSCCTALRALEPDAPRGDLESSLANRLSLLCQMLRAATVHLCCSMPGF